MADFFGEIEEIPFNVCGQIADRFVIEAPIDDLVKRDFLTYHVCDSENPDFNLLLMFPRHDVKQSRKNTSVHRLIAVIEATKNRSVHFPRLIMSGKLPQLIFGADGEQAIERDPEWPDRPMALIETDTTLLATLPCLAPNGALPVETAIHVGLGMFRALAALHRAGFVHRLVSPFSFTVPSPPTVEGIQRGITFFDMSHVIPFPIKPRVFVPFVGTMRYSSLRAHMGREQGPSDDVISLIYVVAELISGKLPWRSVRDESVIITLKKAFIKSDCFKRLPRELRKLYRDMYLTPGPAMIDHNVILSQFMLLVNRRCQRYKNEMPPFMDVEVPKAIQRAKREKEQRGRNLGGSLPVADGNPVGDTG
uniref:Protein kinase domain-containing protein n=1 Tax=Panagrellus redivivus TaxID=6233 RepID=A0A7E4V8Y3_PANRE